MQRRLPILCSHEDCMHNYPVSCKQSGCAATGKQVLFIIVIIMIIVTVLVIMKCFPAHDELGMCRTSLASPSGYPGVEIAICVLETMHPVGHLPSDSYFLLHVWLLTSELSYRLIMHCLCFVVCTAAAMQATLTIIIIIIIIIIMDRHSS